MNQNESKFKENLKSVLLLDTLTKILCKCMLLVRRPKKCPKFVRIRDGCDSFAPKLCCYKMG